MPVWVVIRLIVVSHWCRCCISDTTRMIQAARQPNIQRACPSGPRGPGRPLSADVGASSGRVSGRKGAPVVGAGGGRVRPQWQTYGLRDQPLSRSGPSRSGRGRVQAGAEGGSLRSGLGSLAACRKDPPEDTQALSGAVTRAGPPACPSPRIQPEVQAVWRPDGGPGGRRVTGQAARSVRRAYRRPARSAW